MVVDETMQNLGVRVIVGLDRDVRVCEAGQADEQVRLGERVVLDHGPVDRIPSQHYRQQKLEKHNKSHNCLYSFNTVISSVVSSL